MPKKITKLWFGEKKPIDKIRVQITQTITEKGTHMLKSTSLQVYGVDFEKVREVVEKALLENFGKAIPSSTSRRRKPPTPIF